MRQGQQHRRGRGRNNNNGMNNNNHQGNRKGQNPLTRSFESNGPDVKVRGTPAHVAEKYLQLARDAHSSGDYVLAENYLQHAEHYNRIILAYREQQGQQSQEGMNGNGRHNPGPPRGEFSDSDDGAPDDGGDGDDGMANEQAGFARHSGADQPRGIDMQPMIDDQRQHHRAPDQPHTPRFRDRPPHRGDRPERSEGMDRPERHADRGFDRPHRERDRERPYRSAEPGGEAREPRHHREPRPMHRDAPRDMPRDAPRDMQRDVPRDVPREAAPAPEFVPPADVAPRDEAAPRRRERFGIGADQPEFLRRPVRRPRREPDAEFAPEAPQSPPVDETPRE